MTDSNQNQALTDSQPTKKEPYTLKNTDLSTLPRMGRKTKLTPELIEGVVDYLQTYETKYGHKIPSVVGICKEFNVSKSTLYDWAEHDDNPFSDIINAINEIQEWQLINGSLSNEFNATISKLILGRHGYTDKQEQQLSGNLNLSNTTEKELDTRINHYLQKLRAGDAIEGDIKQVEGETVGSDE